MTPLDNPADRLRGDPPANLKVQIGRMARPGTCGCPYPLMYDPAAGIWRHLADGGPCLPALAGTAG